MTTDASNGAGRQQREYQRRVSSTGSDQQTSSAQGDTDLSSTVFANHRFLSRHNKLYRTPPTPNILVQLEREKSFVLDSVAVSSISDDFTRSNPKYGSVLPPYNAQKDWHTKRYWNFSGVKETLDRNKQTEPGTSIEGAKQDWFNSAGHRFRYLTTRNERQSNGYSNDLRMGHGFIWQHPNPRAIAFERTPPDFQGYNGRFGYRRTTPSLRQRPSTFGVYTRSNLY